MVAELLSGIVFAGTEKKSSPIEGRRGCNIDAAGRHYAHFGKAADGGVPAIP